MCIRKRVAPPVAGSSLTDIYGEVSDVSNGEEDNGPLINIAVHFIKKQIMKDTNNRW